MSPPAFTCLLGHLSLKEFTPRGFGEMTSCHQRGPAGPARHPRPVSHPGGRPARPLSPPPLDSQPQAFLSPTTTPALPAPHPEDDTHHLPLSLYTSGAGGRGRGPGGRAWWRSTRGTDERERETCLSPGLHVRGGSIIQVRRLDPPGGGGGREGGRPARSLQPGRSAGPAAGGRGALGAVTAD